MHTYKILHELVQTPAMRIVCQNMLKQKLYASILALVRLKSGSDPHKVDVSSSWFLKN